MKSKFVQKRRTESAQEAHRKQLRRRRRRILTVAGAIIMLLTFVVREAFREQLKRMSDAIAAAQNAETEAQAHQIISERQFQLDMLQRRIADKLAQPNETVAISKLDLQMEISALLQRYAEASESVDRLSALLDKLPKRGTEATRLPQRRDEVRNHLNQRHTEIQELIPANNVPNPTFANHIRTSLIYRSWSFSALLFSEIEG